MDLIRKIKIKKKTSTNYKKHNYNQKILTEIQATKIGRKTTW